jgi:hypothetical protein
MDERAPRSPLPGAPDEAALNPLSFEVIAMTPARSDGEPPMPIR